MKDNPLIDCRNREQRCSLLSNWVHYDLALWQAVEELLAVAFGLHTRVEDDHSPGVAASSDQATEALLKFDDRFRQRVLEERLAAACFNRLHASLL